MLSLGSFRGQEQPTRECRSNKQNGVTDRNDLKCGYKSSRNLNQIRTFQQSSKQGSMWSRKKMTKEIVECSTNDIPVLLETRLYVLCNGHHLVSSHKNKTAATRKSSMLWNKQKLQDKIKALLYSVNLLKGVLICKSSHKYWNISCT